MISSDPVITSKRTLQKKKIEHLSKEAIALLQSPTVQVLSGSSGDDDEDSLDRDDDDDDVASDSEDEFNL